ncbi:hypothetical protein Q5P01_014345 [Channa striata]|uniref:Uncharacterized protein n=1 Tax=Channa striata TaxID=64152 RepID=A0AA88MIN8_CHASR|nr:hypothetical protein Q5P01_014345 [Channa striata]
MDLSRRLSPHGLRTVTFLDLLTHSACTFTHTSGPLRETVLCDDGALRVHPNHQMHRAGLALGEPPLKLEMHTRELAVTRGPGEDHIDLTRMLRPSRFLTRQLVYGNHFAHLTF